MLYLLLADLLVLIHLGFVLFVALGGFLVLRWRRLMWIHLPAAAWGALIELAGWICPLTPWENQLRRAGGEVGYTGGFVEHYVLPVLYPTELTRTVQIVLGILVIAVNLAAYALVWRRSQGRGGTAARRVK